jgi:ATP-dependent 26S proteasome regulatory subunit
MSGWEWRRKYRVWEANRKIFVYPENWIEPELRTSSSVDDELRPVVAAARAGRTSVLLSSTHSAAALLAAHSLAAELGLDLYHVDVSRIVSKYVGETEKNLQRVFDAADAGGVLFFDEADPLFGKRSEVKDSHDRYANVVAGYLLQRVERFDGLAILATNRGPDLDDELLQRFHFVIEGCAGEPSSDGRARWRRIVRRRL